MATLVEQYVQSAIETDRLLQQLQRPTKRRGRPPKRQIVAQRGISQERLDRVVDYLRKHPGATQSEIADALAFNSGTVSVAIKQLADRRLANVQGNGERGKHIRLAA